MATLEAIIFDRDESGKFRLRLLDQRLLPKTTQYLDASTCDAAIDAIKTMAVRGAPAIAIAAALALSAEFSNRQPLGSLPAAAVLGEINTKLGALSLARPTAVNLSRMCTRVGAIAAEWFRPPETAALRAPPDAHARGRVGVTFNRRTRLRQHLRACEA